MEVVRGCLSEVVVPRPFILMAALALAAPPITLASSLYAIHSPQPFLGHSYQKWGDGPVPAQAIRRGDVGLGGGHNDPDPVHGYLYYYVAEPYPAEKTEKSYSFSKGLFISMFVVPLVALFGFSYALPAAGIQFGIKRSLEAETTLMNDLPERMLQLYLAAIGSEKCLRRIVCDLGAAKSGLKEENKQRISRWVVNCLGSEQTKLFDLWTPEIYKSFARDYLDGLRSNTCTRFGCIKVPEKNYNKLK